MNAVVRNAIKATLFAIALLSLGAANVWAQQTSLKAQVAGAWSVVSSDVVLKDGKRVQDYGPTPKGLIIFDAGGRYAYVAGHPGRPNFKTAGSLRRDTPAAEFGEAARAFAANFGTWSVDEKEKTLTRKYEIALIPNNSSQVLKATIALTKDELQLVSTAADGAKTELVLRRAK